MFDFNSVHDMIDGISGLNRVNEAKKGLWAVVLFSLIGTVLVVGLSVGIQYLILRVLG